MHTYFPLWVRRGMDHPPYSSRLALGEIDHADVQIVYYSADVLIGELPKPDQGGLLRTLATFEGPNGVLAVAKAFLLLHVNDQRIAVHAWAGH